MTKGGGREAEKRMGKRMVGFYCSVWMVTSCSLSLVHGTVPRDPFMDVLASFPSGKYFVNVLRWMHMSSGCLFAYLPSALKDQDENPSFGAFFACPRALLHKNQGICFLSAVIPGLQDAP